MKKIIRKQSLISRIKSFPLDFLLALNEQRELIDWDSYSETIAIPLGIVLTLIYFFIRLYQDFIDIEPSRNRYFNYDESFMISNSPYFGENSSVLTAFISSSEWLIFIINIVNSLIFFFKTKKYSIYNKEIISSTTSARKVTRRKSLLEILYEYFYPDEEDEKNLDSYWELKIWNPSKFSTYLFVSFSPFNILFLYFSRSSFKNLVFLSSTSFILYFVIVERFLKLIKDRKIIFQETFDEYERKFVKPKLSIQKREVAIDATKGPSYSNSIQCFSPGRTERLFKYHDYKGQESVEKFNHGEFTPLKKQPINLRKSLLTPVRSKSFSTNNPSPLSNKRLYKSSHDLH
ncbi:hypothetical protein WICMUC_005371 [Wickerhamomyces mucosus]|uniref:Nuclear rim protein 1 n=1 Tax=Wickerhamomyces mucosus TaxID=1378264 RepID=A0A9P8T648_9ASCO|nr:hypothetical protein WICMUC_005371 [Wickerhamomyces mucosus]